MDPAELWQEAWDMMVTGLDEEDADMLVGDAAPPDYDAFAESTLPVDDTSATGRPSSRAINTEILKERALQLPQLLLKARQSDDLQMMQSLIEENFSPDCTFQSDSMDEPVTGREHLLRLVSATMDVFPDSISTFKRSYVNKREEIVFEVSVVGTRTDSLAKSPAEGSEMLFHPEDITAKDFHRRMLSKSMRRALSSAEVKRIREIDSKVLRQKALAQMEMVVTGKLRFKSSHAGLLVVHAEHAWKLKMLSAQPVP